MDDNSGNILVDRNGRIGHLIFNNPKRHNAVSFDMWRMMFEAVEALDADPEVRVIVLSGAGDKAFVSGGDISEFDKKRGNAAEAERYSQMPRRARARLASSNKPVIAMINGYCLGGGLAIALLADIRIASQNATFGIPAARIGLAYGIEGVRNLVNAVGKSNAADMLLSARRISAEEALGMGLVSQILPPEELAETVAERAATMAQNAPLSQAASKAAIVAVLSDPEHRDMEALAAIQQRCMDSDDYAEGRLAFREKRAPIFRGV